MESPECTGLVVLSVFMMYLVLFDSVAKDLRSAGGVAVDGGGAIFTLVGNAFDFFLDFFHEFCETCISVFDFFLEHLLFLGTKSQKYINAKDPRRKRKRHMPLNPVEKVRAWKLDRNGDFAWIRDPAEDGSARFGSPLHRVLKVRSRRVKSKSAAHVRSVVTISTKHAERLLTRGTDTSRKVRAFALWQMTMFCSFQHSAIYEQMICDSKSSLQSKERRKPDSLSPVIARGEAGKGHVEVEQSISLFDLSQSPGIRSVESATRSVQSSTRSVESGTQLFGRDEEPLLLCGQRSGLLHFVSPGPRCPTPATPADYQPSLLISTKLNHADSQPSNSPCLASADGKSSNRIKSKEASRAREGVRGPHGNWHATRADFVRADLGPAKPACCPARAGEPTPADKCGGSEPVGPRVSEVPGGPIRSVSVSPEAAEAVKRSLSLESPHTSLSSEHLTRTDSPHTAPPPRA